MKSCSELRSHASCAELSPLAAGNAQTFCCIETKDTGEEQIFIFDTSLLKLKSSSCADQTSEPYRVTSPPLCGDVVMILSEQLSSLCLRSGF